jgi:hypothetical protein
VSERAIGAAFALTPPATPQSISPAFLASCSAKACAASSIFARTAGFDGWPDEYSLRRKRGFFLRSDTRKVKRLPVVTWRTLSALAVLLSIVNSTAVAGASGELGHLSVCQRVTSRCMTF